MNNFEELKTGIKSKVLQALDFSKDISDEEMLELIDRELFGSTRGLAISMESRKNLRLQIFHSIRKLDVLQELVDDPEVTEIMINGVDNIFTERNGRIVKEKLDLCKMGFCESPCGRDVLFGSLFEMDEERLAIVCA